MPRFIPKWLALFAILSIGGGLGVGCSSQHHSDPLDANARLSALTVSAGTLSPSFDASVTTYTLTVPDAVTSTTVTPTLASGKAKVAVDGAALASGATSAAIALHTGLNSLSVVVTAENGAKQVYTLAITRSSDTRNDLASLGLSAGALSPAFDPATTAYEVALTSDTQSLSITPEALSPTATIKVDGVGVASGESSALLPLVAGDNVISVAVTAASGAVKTYTVNAKVILNSNALLASLTLSKGVLSPAFDAAVQAYGVDLYSGAASLSLTPTLQSPKATVTVNGSPVVSGSASQPISLAVGQTAIPVVVTAENGATSTTVITVAERSPSTPVWVLDSSNGSPVPNAQLTLTDATGKVLEDGIALNAEGTVTLGLNPAAIYNLYAKGTASAQASFIHFEPSKEASAHLYGHALGMINFPAQAPSITQISYSPDGLNWTPVSGNQITDALANIACLKVTAIGTSGVSPTAWSGFGIGTNVDRPAWVSDYVPAYQVDENSVATQVNGLPYFQSTSAFGLSLDNFVSGGSHYIDVVAYDVANNRTEQRIYVTVSDVVTVPADPDLSAITPASMIVQLGTYGLSRDFYAVQPVDGNNITYSALVAFNIGSGASATGIRGFEVYRAADGGPFAKINTTHYGSLYTGNNGQYTYSDLDPSLKEGVSYTYKVRAFTGNTASNDGYSLESTPVSAQFLRPYTVALAAPANSAVSSTLKPTFQFTISNPALFDPAVSDYFRFYLFIKDKVGASVFGQAYRYNFIAGQFQKLVGASYVDASAEVSISADHTTLSILYPNATTLMPGITYEWSIFGTKGSASNTTSDASSFLKYYGGGTAGRGLSYGSTYEKSYGAINGFFTLTIDPSAQ